MAATIDDQIVQLDAVTRRRVLAYMRALRLRIEQLEREVFELRPTRKLKLVKGDDGE